MLVSIVGIPEVTVGGFRGSFLKHVTLSNPVQGKVFDEDVNLHFTGEGVYYRLERPVYALKARITGWIDNLGPTTMDFGVYEAPTPFPFITREICHVDHSGGGKKNYDCTFPLPPVGLDVPKVPRCSTG